MQRVFEICGISRYPARSVIGDKNEEIAAVFGHKFSTRYRHFGKVLDGFVHVSINFIISCQNLFFGNAEQPPRLLDGGVLVAVIYALGFGLYIFIFQSLFVFGFGDISLV